MRTVDLIHRKRDGEELTPEEIEYLVEGYTSGDIPDYQMSAFLMATVFSGHDGPRSQRPHRKYDAIRRRCSIFPTVPGMKVDKHSTGGVGDKTSLIAAPIAAAAGVIVPMMSGRALGHTGGTLDKLESIPGFRTDLTVDGVQRPAQVASASASSGRREEIAPADGKLYALRDATATVESIPLIASSIMSKKMAEGVDALVLDVKVGTGAFMKKQVEARRLAQMMVGIGRRMDKRVQALITDMNQPLGYAIGNALEVMEVSQTLQNAGPADLTRLSARTRRAHDLPRQDRPDAGRSAQTRRKQAARRLRLPQVQAKWSQAQGGNPQVLDRFELLPNATGVREIASPRARLRQRHRRRGHRPGFHHDRRGPRSRRKTRSIPPSA